MIENRHQLEQAIAALEAQRALLGDDVVDAAIGPMQEKLAALKKPQDAEQRKLVTVLFADLVGFTALASGLDPEDLREIINTYFKLWEGHIESYGGRVEKYIGDAVMAVFGLAASQEDDPEQAIRAALDMRAALTSLNHQLKAQWAVELTMRVGIHTGPVMVSLLGERKGQDFVVVGDTVNLTSRLQGAAPSGGILISHDTYRHVRGVFDVDVIEGIRVKGKEERIQVYLVRQAKPRAFRMGRRGIENIDTRTVGREKELLALQEAYHSAVEKQQTTVVALVGEAGVGKSRLVYEFNNWLELQPESIWFFKGRASQQTQGIPQHLLRDLLANRFEILDSDPLEVVREKFSDGISRFLPEESEMKAQILGAWLGYDFSGSPHLQPMKDDPEQIKNRATLYLAQFFSATTDQNTTVVILDDIHWADSSSLETITDLARRRAGLPLLVVCLARPSFYERMPEWEDGIPAYTRLNLGPLSAEDSRSLVEEILRLVKPLPQELVDLVSSRAEGNPFYAEELVKMLIDDGVIRTGQENWTIKHEQLEVLEVPSTLTEVLQVRLDKLLPLEKQSIQEASVIGRIFWDRALSELDFEGPEALPVLQTKEFIFHRDKSAFEGSKEYIFKHAILRDVTYETVLKRVRGKYHNLAADWLAAAAETNGRCDEYAALIGEHYQLAGKNEQAAFWYGRAGQQAVKIYAQELAVRYLGLALELTPKEAYAARFRLLEDHEKALHLLGDREAQQQDLVQLETLSESLDDAAKAKAALRQAYYANVLSEYDQAISKAQTAISLAHRIQDLSMEAAGYSSCGHSLIHKSQYKAAQVQFETGLHLAQGGNHLEQICSCLAGLGSVNYEQGKYSLSIQYFKQALEIAKDNGYQKYAAGQLTSLGLIAQQQGDLVAARDFFEQALVISREIGDRLGEGIFLNNLGLLATLQRDYNHAKEYYAKSLDISRETESKYGEGMALVNLGFICWNACDFNRARDYFQQALDIFRTIGNRDTEGIILINLGHLDSSQGNIAAAKGCYAQALEILREIGTQWGEGISLNELGAAALAQEELPLAEDYYQQALIVRQNLKQPQYLVEDWAGLAKLKLAKGEKSVALDYGQQVLAYLRENPHLEGAENPVRVFRFTWEVLSDLEKEEEANQVLSQAVRIMQDELENNIDATLVETYLNQPHHAVLWSAWKRIQPD